MNAHPRMTLAYTREVTKFRTRLFSTSTIVGMDEKNLPDKVDELLTEVVNKDPITLASISAVPYFGGVLATFFSAKWLEIYQERTAELFRQFSEHLSDLDEQAIRRDYFDTPEGIDLLIKATEASSKTSSNKKRDFIARTLRGAMLDYGRGEYSAEEYLNLISDLTERELVAATFLYNEYRRNSRRTDLRTTGIRVDSWTRKLGRELGLDETDARIILTRLRTRGLVDIELEENPVRKSNPTRLITVEPAFRKLIKLLELKE